MPVRHKQLKEIEDTIETVKRKLLDEMYRENAEPYSGPTLATLKGAYNYLQFAQNNLVDAREYGKTIRDDIRMHGLTKFSTETVDDV